MFEATFIKYLRTKTITAKYFLDICDCFVFYSETIGMDVQDIIEAIHNSTVAVYLPYLCSFAIKVNLNT